MVFKSTFKGHTYTFASNFYLQGEGGPIGLRLTTAVARLVCLWWDKIFISRCMKLGITILMHKRYVDECNHVARKIPTSLTYEASTQSMVSSTQPNSIEVNSNEQLQSSPDYNHTFQVLRVIANDISLMLKWTKDVP